MMHVCLAPCRGVVGLALVAAMLAGLCGCRVDPSLEPLQNENRMLEDRIFDLEREYAMLHDRYASCRRENDTYRRELGDGTSAPETIRGERRTNRSDAGGDTASPPSVLLPGAGSGGVRNGSRAADEFVPPEIDLGIPADPDNGSTLELPPPDGAGVGPILGPSATIVGRAPIADASRDGGATLPDDSEIAKISLNSRLTGGYDFDGRAGDDGVMVVIEPQNAAGEYVPLPGPVSVAVIDPALDGEAARVARWEFASDEIESMIRRSLFGRGIHLELPWPNEPPKNERLVLFVRYIALDGRKLEAKREIRAVPQSEIGDRWTPAPPRRQARLEPPPESRPVTPTARPSWSPHR